MPRRDRGSGDEHGNAPGSRGDPSKRPAPDDVPESDVCEVAHRSNRSETRGGVGSGAEMYSPISQRHDLLVRIAYNLRRLRSEHGYTQQELAAQVGGRVRANEISRWENAHTRPSEPKLFQLAEIFGVDVSELFAEIPEEGSA